MRILILFVFLAFTAQVAHSHDVTCEPDTTNLYDILKSLSDRTGAKFVLDPRVRTSIETVGIDMADIDYDLFVTILSIHALSAVESNGVIYIVPSAVEEMTRERLSDLQD